MTDQVSLRFGQLGQLHVRFGNVFVVPGYATHGVSVQVQVTGSWLDSEEPSTSLASILLTGTVWTDQPSHSWVGGLNPLAFTARGVPMSELLTLTLTDDQLVALERARGET